MDLISRILYYVHLYSFYSPSWRSVADACESNDETSRDECLVMLQAIEEEHAEVEEKLKLLLQDKENVGSGDNSGHGHSGHGKSVSFNEKEEVNSKPKRAQVYQLTCRECNDDLNYIGKTRRDLKKQVKRHFDDVWRIVEKEQGDDNEVEQSQAYNQEDFAFSPFAKHFVRHCRNAQSYEEVMRWCSSNIKVQRQKIEDWEQLEEDDELTRTVYQLSCRCCVSPCFILARFSTCWPLIYPFLLSPTIITLVRRTRISRRRLSSITAMFGRW